MIPGMTGLISSTVTRQWTPARIAAPVWFDASDLSTMRQEITGAGATTPAGVGDPVGSWRNKGTLGGWAVAPDNSARPVLQSSGGIYWLEFDGTDDWLSCTAFAASLFQNVGSGLIAAAARSGTQLGNIVGVSSGTSNTAARSNLYHQNAAGFVCGGRRLDSNSNQTTSNAGSNDVSDRCLRAHWVWQDADLFLYRDGVLFQSNTSFQTAGNTSNTASLNVGLGTLSGTNNFLSGRIYAIVLGHHLPASAEMTSLDQWLASKQGRSL